SFGIHNSEFILDLIDTPGHVDFTYEVSRALACVEGAILLVDATQGVQAQTIANLNLARQEKLVIIPVINKVDLGGARIKETEDELMNLLGCAREDILKISAKTGDGVEKVLCRVLERVPTPKQIPGNSTVGRALIFDSHFDSFRGVIAHVRVFDGEFKKGDKVFMLASRSNTEIMEIGYFAPALVASGGLKNGEIGYIATGLKEPEMVRIGDTITNAPFEHGSAPKGVTPLFGYKEPKPMVFASMYPEDADDYEKLRDALKKIKLNDASIFFEPEASDALGRGFRVGFLGMLHMEIVGERLKREYTIDLIFTAPSVAYFVKTSKGSEYVYSASRLPEEHLIQEIHEPWVKLEIITPQRFLGGAMSLLRQTRGSYSSQAYLGADRLTIAYEVPLKDILVDFFDKLKSVTEGYGSLGYELLDYRLGDLVRLDIVIANEREEAFSQVIPREKSYDEGRVMVQKLKELLPKQLFAVAIQAVVSGKVLARETIPALKKDVTGYLYGGDRTRKMKLWKKQKRGKEQLKESGRVEIPPDVFLKMLKR
ncbi:MAG: elongation factor 4, partial [Candidatus Sungbacteria bacterium]|nr:elongation factor 4 [Candidatus Sungbacteria bacterium]